MKTGSHVQSHINKYAKKDISQMYKDFNIKRIERFNNLSVCNSVYKEFIIKNF